MCTNLNGNIMTAKIRQEHIIGTYESRFHIGLLQYDEVIKKSSLALSGALSDNRAISKQFYVVSVS